MEQEVFNTKAGFTKEFIKRKQDPAVPEKEFLKKEMPEYERISGQTPKHRQFLKERRIDG